MTKNFWFLLAERINLMVHKEDGQATEDTKLTVFNRVQEHSEANDTALLILLLPRATHQLLSNAASISVLDFDLA